MKLYTTASQLYVAESGRIRTASSRSSVDKTLRQLQSQYPDHHIAHFTTEDLTDFCLSSTTDRLPSPNTVRKRRVIVRGIFGWLHWKKLVEDNPAVDLEYTVRPGQGSRQLGVWLDESQVISIWKAFGTSEQIDRRDRLIFLTAVITGLRVIELQQLTWDKFAPDLSSVTLVGKGGKPALIAVPEQLRTELLRWRREAWYGAKAVFPVSKLMRSPANGRWTRIFLWDSPLSEDGIRNAVHRAGELIGIHINPHDLRRSFAGILETKGVSLKDIQLALRHSNLATTDRYLSSNPARTHRTTSGLTLDLG